METQTETVLTLIRKFFTDNSTIGELLIGMDHQCWCLEDTCRDAGVKIYGKTAIPPGRYELALYNSTRNKGFVPLLLGVPGFEYVEMHVGNYPKDTNGCILIGSTRFDDQPDCIFDSRIAFKALMDKLEPAFKSGKVYLEIVGSRKQPYVQMSF